MKIKTKVRAGYDRCGGTTRCGGNTRCGGTTGSTSVIRYYEV
jgi:hypothetical protein